MNTEEFLPPNLTQEQVNRVVTEVEAKLTEILGRRTPYVIILHLGDGQLTASNHRQWEQILRGAYKDVIVEGLPLLSEDEHKSKQSESSGAV